MRNLMHVNLVHWQGRCRNKGGKEDSCAWICSRVELMVSNSAWFASAALISCWSGWSSCCSYCLTWIAANLLLYILCDVSLEMFDVSLWGYHVQCCQRGNVCVLGVVCVFWWCLGVCCCCSGVCCYQGRFTALLPNCWELGGVNLEGKQLWIVCLWLFCKAWHGCVCGSSSYQVMFHGFSICFICGCLLSFVLSFGNRVVNVWDKLWVGFEEPCMEDW